MNVYPLVVFSLARLGNVAKFGSAWVSLFGSARVSLFSSAWEPLKIVAVDYS